MDDGTAAIQLSIQLDANVLICIRSQNELRLMEIPSILITRAKKCIGKGKMFFLNILL